MDVLNIGSLNIDRTYRVQSFVQPGETIKAISYEERSGGKGLNQSVAMARAGVTVRHIGAIGSDGSSLTAYMQQVGVCCSGITEMPGPTGHAVIQVTDSGENSIIVCSGANSLLSCETIDQALESASPGTIVLIQNETSNVGYAMAAAKSRGLRVAFNPSPFEESIFDMPLEKVDIFIVNEIEASLLCKTVTKPSDDELALCLMKQYPQSMFMVTLGSRGCMLVAHGVVTRQEAFQVNAVDTTGAGDTFCGYFLAGLAEGLPAQETLLLASAAAALSVTSEGAAASIPCRQDVNVFLQRHSASFAAA